ncbi:radical SAM protein [Vallitalea sp.]|jgi:MoaA/NifB/PqqE/SkfB family radical SAM enzyme|uniref:radical SAM protein n=1 Tax=Vallitalea sp. TaxID=1882829 RepID=UPI0025E71CA1|nr:radical SAM protein [Vallitalea sp.]MCT4686245.1 radical SAM protein [Vallitalea sp.]
MNEKLKLLHSGLTITQRCSLKCKLCAGYSPYYNPQPHYSLELLSDIIDRYFSIVDHVEKFTVTGGEPLIHEDLARIIEKIIEYRNQFDKIEIITNGTIFPNNELQSTLEKYGKKDGCLIVMVDHYGELSTEVSRIKNYFEDKKIDHRIRIYHGDNPHCGGWVNFNDFSLKSHNEKDIIKKFRKCGLPKINFCFAIKNGEMHPCTFSHRIMELNIITRNKSEYIDLFDDNTVEQQKNKLRNILNLKYFGACAYCNGMCEDSQRYKPAEQL